MKERIQTPYAPQAIGTYSQAVRLGKTVYLSGQIPLDPVSMQLVEGDIATQTHQVFKNMQYVVAAAGGTFADIVKIGIFLTDLSDFAVVNEVMAEYFTEPYPARSTVQVSALPKEAQVEVEAIMVLPS